MKQRVFKHYKGGLYRLLTDQAINEADGKAAVVYQSLNPDDLGQIYVRPAAEFPSRFTEVL